MTLDQNDIHLTETQLADWLLAEHTPAAAVHMQACPACQQRAAAFTSVLGDFNQAALSWAEVRSNTIPAPSRRIPRSAFWHLLPAPALVLTAAFVLSFGWTHYQTAGTANGAAANLSTTSPSIAHDNALLADIDAALATPERSPLEAYQIPSYNGGADAAQLAGAAHTSLAGH